MDHINLIGVAAGTLCTISFLPQLIKIWKTKSARDVSLVMFVIFSAGITLWMWYGFLTHSMPIILANGVTLVLSMVIVCFKVKYK
jgi:MtN3 and saliva related transmembrane protein